jgi:large subunit ribosomal protein L22e
MKKKTPTPVKDEKKEKTHHFIIDCSKPVEDKVFVTSVFAQYLKERIKVHGKIGQLGENIKIS